MIPDESLDSRICGNKSLSQLRKRDTAYDHEQGYAVLNHCGKLIGLVTYAPIVSDRDPTLAADFLKPFFVRTVMLEMVGMALNRQASGPEGLRKLLAQVPVREEDRRHATRS